MSLITKIDTEPDTDWNKRLADDKNSTVHQTADFGIFQSERQNQPTYYITFKKNNKIVGQLVLLKFSRIERKFQNLSRRSSLVSKLMKTVKNLKPIYIWYFGPSIFETSHKEEIFKEISKLGKKFNAPIRGSLRPLDHSVAELFSNNWTEIKKGTFLIDLTQSPETLWNNIDRQSGRKAVNRALKRGIKVTEIKNLDELKIHHNLLLQGREIANMTGPSFNFIKLRWELLRNVGSKGFIAWLDEQPIASTLLTSFNGYINEQGFARSKMDKEQLLNGTDMIKWHIIKWGANSGCKTFDLSGVEADLSDKKNQGIFKFKKKWGGTYQNWYHYSFNPHGENN